ncbi:MAG TPA: GDP-mannose 4,6-dehydratase [Verrucomicrobiae bacterium]|nr:GDP-mannose 4,6-dehydratase [Verrucomicrobiae bacterium]
MKTAVITGSAGQDGHYLSQHLDELGYEVAGFDYDSTAVDIVDADSVARLLRERQPSEVYHLAAYHHSSQDKLTEDLEVFRKSNDVHTVATANFLDGIRRFSPSSRFFFAASSHLFGIPPTPVQDENTPLAPDGLYGITKEAGLRLCHYYREKYGVFAAVGILYNHESPLRPAKFVSKKIVQAAVAIRAGRQKTLVLGDLDAQIDWGFAGDYVDAMHRILQLPAAEDFVIASGTAHRVRDFVEETFRVLGLNWEEHVVVDPTLLRGTTRVPLAGNPAKLRRLTGWEPQTSFQDLVHLMVSAEQAAGLHT